MPETPARSKPLDVHMRACKWAHNNCGRNTMFNVTCDVK